MDTSKTYKKIDANSYTVKDYGSNNYKKIRNISFIKQYYENSNFYYSDDDIDNDLIKRMLWQMKKKMSFYQTMN